MASRTRRGGEAISRRGVAAREAEAGGRWSEAPRRRGDGERGSEGDLARSIGGGRRTHTRSRGMVELVRLLFGKKKCFSA
jgi:hypothetical protein